MFCFVLLFCSAQLGLVYIYDIQISVTFLKCKVDGAGHKAAVGKMVGRRTVGLVEMLEVR